MMILSLQACLSSVFNRIKGYKGVIFVIFEINQNSPPYLECKLHFDSLTGQQSLHVS